MKIIERIKDFWLNHFETYVTICQHNEHIYVGRRLWKLIEADLAEGERNDIRVFFKKYPVIDKNGATRKEYLMIINPEFEGLTDPNGEKPFTAQLQLNVFGHLGFQSAQPTPAEIVYEYDIQCDFADKVKLRVKQINYNGKHAYVFLNSTIGKPIKPTYKEERVSPHI